jgi:hypothetical protein
MGVGNDTYVPGTYTTHFSNINDIVYLKIRSSNHCKKNSVVDPDPH